MENKIKAIRTSEGLQVIQGHARLLWLQQQGYTQDEILQFIEVVEEEEPTDGIDQEPAQPV